MLDSKLFIDIQLRKWQINEWQLYLISDEDISNYIS